MDWIVDVIVYLGEDELEVLVEGVFCVLCEEEVLKEYVVCEKEMVVRG